MPGRKKNTHDKHAEKRQEIGRLNNELDRDNHLHQPEGDQEIGRVHNEKQPAREKEVPLEKREIGRTNDEQDPHHHEEVWLTSEIRKRANFGLEVTPFAHGLVSDAGTNAKLSEYHAAVALASLDRWRDSFRWRVELERQYRERLAGIVEMQDRPQGAYTTFPVLAPDAAEVAKRMAGLGIETRRWYTPTLERHPAFASLKVDGPLTKCAELNDRALCLPFHVRMTSLNVDRVCEALKWAITKTEPVRAFTA